MKILCAGDGGLTSEIIAGGVKKLGNAELLYADMDYTDLVKCEKTHVSLLPVPECIDNAKDAEIAVFHYCTFSEEGMKKMPGLKILSTLRGGYENIDVEAATKLGIACVHSPGRNAHAVSDFTVGMILAEVLNISRMHANMMNKVWEKDYPTTSITPHMLGKTIGLYGFGQIGHLVAKKLSGFDMNVLVYDPYVDPGKIESLGYRVVDKETLFKESDFISVHARLTEESYHSIGEKEFALMKPRSWFINSARSGMVDYDALLKVLQEHKIAGAALDVFDQEPLPADSPFYDLDNVTLTPHFAGGAREHYYYAADLATKGVESILDGKPNFQVLNPEVCETEEFKAWVKKANEELGRK